MIQELHHIGIAVRSLDAAIERYVRGLGLTFHGIEEVPTEKVRVAVVTAGRTRIELLEPTSSDSPIAKFLERRGPGVHHLAFQVDGCAQQIRILTEQGAHLLDAAPRQGAHGTKVAFVHPRWLDGVLAELVEPPAP